MDWREVPSFYATLGDGATGHLALRLPILTGARWRAIRFARSDQVHRDICTIPGEGEGGRMKGRKDKVGDFRVPLPPAALEVVRTAGSCARDGWLFPGTVRRKAPVISDATMAKLLNTAGFDARPHGFRSSFGTWAEEMDIAGETVVEMAVAHATGSKVSRAYRRSDLLDTRRKLMEAWSDWVTGGGGHRSEEIFPRRRHQTCG